MSTPSPISTIPPSENHPAVVPGQMLANKFRVERIIGEGGMGIVAEATHLQLDERVALKFLRREVMRMPDVVARFDREARAAVKLKSEHVARVIDVGKTEDGIPFMVMEYLEGRDLSQVVAENGPLPMQVAAEYVIQACEGVGEAHARGIVHRDLKPENLFLVRRQDGWQLVKVLDFGISKAVLVGPTDVNLASNQTTSIMGSPYYMSPEQLRSTRSVDHRADIWSLGVVLFELLTGQTIFDEAKEFTELVAEILESRHRSLRAYRPDAPQGLEDIIDKCLEKDRNARFQNAAELAVALLPYAPRRARVTAERTTSITKAAGLITDPNFTIPPSNYPPAPDGYTPAPGAFVAPPVPNFNDQSGAGTPGSGQMYAPPHQSNPMMMAPQSTPSLPMETDPGPRKRPPIALIFFFIFATLGIGVAIAYFGVRALAPKPQQATTQPTQTTPVQVEAPKPTATATASVAASTEEPAVKATTGTRPGIKPQIGYVPVKPTATTSTAVTVSRPALDIQLQR